MFIGICAVLGVFICLCPRTCWLQRVFASSVSCRMHKNTLIYIKSTRGKDFDHNGNPRLLLVSLHFVSSLPPVISVSDRVLHCRFLNCVFQIANELHNADYNTRSTATAMAEIVAYGRVWGLFLVRMHPFSEHGTRKCGVARYTYYAATIIRSPLFMHPPLKINLLKWRRRSRRGPAVDWRRAQMGNCQFPPRTLRVASAIQIYLYCRRCSPWVRSQPIGLYMVEMVDYM